MKNSLFEINIPIFHHTIMPSFHHSIIPSSHDDCGIPNILIPPN